MSFTATSSMVVKPMSSIFSKPHFSTLFTTTQTLTPSPNLSISSKQFKISNLCCSYSTLKFKKLRFGLVVPLVTQEEGAVAVEEEEVEEEEEVVVASEENEVVEEEETGEEESYPEPPEEAKLFVGNLPYDVDSEALAQLFNQAGVVEIAEVIYNRETDQSRGFGFVTMSTVEEAELAVEKFNTYQINGRSLTVNKAAPRGAPRPERTPRTFAPSFRMYVGNLPWQVDDARLEQVFSEHGKVVDARVVFDRETQRSRGFGFVTMSNETEMNDAIEALDGQSLEGRAIRVNVAEDRPRRNSF